MLGLKERSYLSESCSQLRLLTETARPTRQSIHCHATSTHNCIPQSVSTVLPFYNHPLLETKERRSAESEIFLEPSHSRFLIILPDVSRDSDVMELNKF